MNRVLATIGGGAVVALLLAVGITNNVASAEARPKQFESRPKPFSVTSSITVR